MRTTLILGCGYVGRAFAQRERALGNRVLAVTRNSDMGARLRDEGVSVFEGNVHESGWHAFARDVNWALNCVSAASPDLEGYRLSYGEGNRSFARWMEASRFEGSALFTGSVSVYADSEGRWLDEAKAEAHSERAEILLEGERAFLEADCPAAKSVARLGGIYGPGRSFLADRIQASSGALPGYGDYFLNLIRLEDIVTALEAILAGGCMDGGVFNVVDDAPMLKADLVAGLAETLGMEPPRFDPNLKSARGSRRLDGQRPANRRISNRRLKERFGWEPHFASGLAGMADLISS